MNAPALARSLPASAARAWRSLRRRARLALALAAAVVLLVAWVFLREPPEEWPSRTAFELPRRNWALAFAPDGRTLLTAGVEGIIPWDAKTGRKGTPWAGKEGLFASRGSYSPDGRTFAAPIFHHPKPVAIELFDATTGRSRATLATGHPKVYDLAFAEEGRTLRAFLGDGPQLKEAVTWDVATGREASRRTIAPPTPRSTTAISPDGRLLALVPASSKAIQLWDLEADVALVGLPIAAGGASYGTTLAFSADGRTLAAGRDDGALDLWDVPARRLLRTLAGHPRGYVSMYLWFAPDGRTLASAGSEFHPSSGLVRAYDDLARKLFGPAKSAAELIVVDLATGRRVARTSTLMFASYAPDGRAVATTGEDLRVRLHDLPDSPR